MADHLVLTTLEDGVLTVTLNRPERLNAITPALRGGMIAALDRADADDDIRVVIFTGAGRGYCAGADNTSPVSVAITRRMLWRIGNAPHPRAAHEVESAVIPFRAASADAAEGVAAFMAKRKAQFRGRASSDIPPDLPLG